MCLYRAPALLWLFGSRYPIQRHGHCLSLHVHCLQATYPRVLGGHTVTDYDISSRSNPPTALYMMHATLANSHLLIIADHQPLHPGALPICLWSGIPAYMPLPSPRSLNHDNEEGAIIFSCSRIHITCTIRPHGLHLYISSNTRHMGSTAWSIYVTTMQKVKYFHEVKEIINTSMGQFMQPL
jgi:hypothetical protein